MENNNLFGALPSPIDTRDYRAESILSREVILPSKLDLSYLISEVRDQGTQSACVAMTCAGMKEYQERENTGYEQFSPQFIYNLRVNSDSQGMYPRDAMKILHNVGCVKEKDFKYNSIGFPGDLFEKAKNYKIQAYAQIDTIEGLKIALYKNGPCMICVPTYDAGPQMWKSKNGQKEPIGAHAMLVVGYDEKGFILKNSWGRTWGDNGYTHMPYSDWGVQYETWTTIDDNSSIPDPLYNIWWRKQIRRFIKLYQGAKGLIVPIVFSLVGGFLGFYLGNNIILVISFLILLGLSIYIYKNKLYQ